REGSPDGLAGAVGRLLSALVAERAGLAEHVAVAAAITSAGGPGPVIAAGSQALLDPLRSLPARYLAGQPRGGAAARARRPTGATPSCRQPLPVPALREGSPVLALDDGRRDQFARRDLVARAVVHVDVVAGAAVDGGGVVARVVGDRLADR